MAQICVLFDSPAAPAWKLRLLERLRTIPDARLQVVAQSKGTKPRTDLGLLSPLLKNVAIQSGVLPGEATGAVPLGCDYVVDLRDEQTPLETAASILSFRFGSSKALPYAYEALHGQLATAEMICRDARGYRVMRSARFIFGIRYRRLLERVFSVAIKWPSQYIQTKNNESGALRSIPYEAEKRPTWWRLASDTAMLGLGLAHRAVQYALQTAFVEGTWNVGVLNAAIADVVKSGVTSEGAKWLLPMGDFAADPFVIESDGKRRILYESYDRRDRKAAIRSVEFGHKDTIADDKLAIDRDSHLSYPFVFELDGERWCIPENSAEPGVRAYRLDTGGMPSGEPVLMLPEIRACDATLLRHDGRLWLFCTRADKGPNEALYLYSAPSLTGPWEAHVANPVKIDVGSARPAGALFYHEGELYRPGQDCIKNYGAAIVIHRVSRLTRTHFDEEPVARIEPAAPYPRGVHTLTVLDTERIVVDGLRTYLTLGKILRRLAAITKRKKRSNAQSVSLELETVDSTEPSAANRFELSAALGPSAPLKRARAGRRTRAILHPLVFRNRRLWRRLGYHAARPKRRAAVHSKPLLPSNRYRSICAL